MSEQPVDSDVWMSHPDLAAVASPPLPSGYRMRFYGEGDLYVWLRIQAHDPFFVPTTETFTTSMPGDTALLATRVMFLADPTGEDVGTVTAWSNDRLTGREIGQIHWVALVPAAQGQGLAKPDPAALLDVTPGTCIEYFKNKFVLKYVLAGQTTCQETRVSWHFFLPALLQTRRAQAGASHE